MDADDTLPMILLEDLQDWAPAAQCGVRRNDRVRGMFGVELIGHVSRVRRGIVTVLWPHVKAPVNHVLDDLEVWK